MSEKRSWYIGLVHGPVNNKNGAEITTSVTNLDIHDIARSARTFGFVGYHIITPIKLQQELVRRILDHWNTDHGNEYNPDRKEALSFAQLSNSIEETIQKITETHGVAPIVVVTGANFESHDGRENKLLEKLALDNKPMLLLFGTGWGLTAAITEAADFRLEPIFGRPAMESDEVYNHLSVRSAVAIYCDRLTRQL
ncbi:MAG: hypothetical protein ACI9QD_000146 [Thermoproteota archaeon]|jgi:hypothetical protein